MLLRRFSLFALVALIAALGSTACESGPKGSEDSAAEGSKENQSTDTEEYTMKLSSDAFADGETIPERYTCVGEGESPPLSWEEAPEETSSFVVFCEDPDAPGGTFKHWAAFEISGETTSLKAGAASNPSFSEGTNDFGDVGYGAPCPPPGDGAHRYQFYVWALGTESLDVGEAPGYDAVRSAAEEHKLAAGKLTGKFSR